MVQPPEDSGPQPLDPVLHSEKPSVTVTDEPRSITALPQILGSRLVPCTTSPIQIGDISNHHLTPSPSPSSIIAPSKPAHPHSTWFPNPAQPILSPSHHSLTTCRTSTAWQTSPSTRTRATACGSSSTMACTTSQVSSSHRPLDHELQHSS